MTQPLIPALVPPRPVPAEVALLRPTVIEVELAALAHNVALLRSRLAPGVKLLAVVKADAYGHGAIPCARTFVESGADWLGVALVEEGVELRRAGLLAPICILSGLGSHSDARVIVSHRLTPLVSRPDHLDAMAAAAHDAGLDRYPIHLKVDTGMARWGALPSEVGPFLDALQTHPGLVLEGLATHLACADSPEESAVSGPLHIFRGIEAFVRDRGFAPTLRHIGNSAALLAHPKSHGDMVRPGLALYGASPFDTPVDGLRPVLTLKTRITHLKTLPAGAPIGYGASFHTTRSTRVATVPIGYADGLPRRVSNRARMLIRGRPASIVGRVCMDACMLDVTDIDDAALGDEVVILGRQGDATIGPDELGRHAETLSYEILTGLGKRVPRTYR